MRQKKTLSETHAPPAYIHGAKIIILKDSQREYKGELWVTLLPEDEADDRIWEFSLTTGWLLKTN